MTWDEVSRASGIPKSTLMVWERRLRQSDSPKRRGRSSFAEIVSAECQSPSAATSIEIVLRNGRRVVAAIETPIDDLRRIVNALDPPC